MDARVTFPRPRPPAPRAARWIALLAALAALGACGSLDNVTDVHDLRVLGVKSEPAGFLVPLDDPSSLTNTQAKITALVADPENPSQIVTFTGQACPDYIDTITAATGKSSKLCPDASTTSKLPSPLDTELATTELPAGMAPASAGSTIEYDPQVMFGLTPDQLGFFFSPTATGNATIDQAVLYNRDFSFDAIVDLTFTLGTQSAEALKRVVYWPLLPAALVPDPTTNAECPSAQVANTNPVLTSIDLFRQRVDGMPADEWTTGTTPTVSISAKDELFVRPSYDPASIEHYLLRVKNLATGVIETQCHHELLTFQFFATAGTFSPATRTSELSVLRTSDNGYVPLDSQYDVPKAADIPADGVVTIWIVARDERAGASWLSRTFVLQP
jgi:hypothetical protein